MNFGTCLEGGGDNATAGRILEVERNAAKRAIDAFFESLGMFSVDFEQEITVFRLLFESDMSLK